MKKALSVLLFLIYAALIVLLFLLNKKPKPVDDDEEEEEELIDRSENIGQSGDLKVTAMWDFHGDVDLHVMQPNGNEIYFDNTVDNDTGGNLDIDNQQGGQGAAENIYWENPPAGQYVVELVFYKFAEEYEGNNNSGVVHVIIKKKGQRAERHDIRVREPDPSNRIRVATVRIYEDDGDDDDDDEDEEDDDEEEDDE